MSRKLEEGSRDKEKRGEREGKKIKQDKVKRENQKDATNSMFIIKLSVSTVTSTVHTAQDAAPQGHSQPQPNTQTEHRVQ